jgi:hypothetical protein
VTDAGPLLMHLKCHLTFVGAEIDGVSALFFLCGFSVHSVMAV